MPTSSATLEHLPLDVTLGILQQLLDRLDLAVLRVSDGYHDPDYELVTKADAEKRLKEERT